MLHVGDITKLNGAELEPVWCITGGSPCQDLSVAGKRAGLAGARSGLFMEQVRIVKEMREHDRSNGRTDESVRPRYMVWENVPGAFSSNFNEDGGDFGAVLEEVVRVAEPTFALPRLPDKQKWTKAGVIVGDTWSVAWRTHDAQYWGVPQRRRRISLVADFGGTSAGEILFERQSLPRDSEPCGTERKETAGHSETGTGEHDRDVAYTLKIRGGVDVDSNGKSAGKGALIQTYLSATLGVTQDQTLFQCVGADAQIDKELYGCLTASANSSGNNKAAVAYGLDARNAVMDEEKQSTLQNGAFRSLNCGNVVAYSFYPQMKAESQCWREDVANTLVNGTNYGFQNGVVCPSFAIGNGQVNQSIAEQAGALNCMHDQQAVMIPVAYGIGAYNSNAWKSGNPDSGVYEADTSKTLDALQCCNPSCNQGGMAVCEPIALENHPADSRVTIEKEGKIQTLSSRMGTGGGNVPMVMEKSVGCFQNTGAGWWNESECAGTVRANGSTWEPENAIAERVIRWIVRRLTPLECTRLQGFPDGWVDIGEWTDSKGKLHKDADSPKYKALGNSIAIPFWYWMFNRMAKYLPDDATLGSLFDGIGGFPYCWEKIHGKGTARWASEIEDFPIAVTKIRFPEVEA